jgi:protein dithiol oxidoreductase (disulfide-forming)
MIGDKNTMHPRRRFLLFTMLLTGLAIASSASAQFLAGKDYLVISPPQPTDSGNKVEVIEFFWYGCPHCNALMPSLDAWLKQKPADVEYRRVPAVLGQSWIPLTQAFYTFEALGLTEKFHHDVYAAIHKDKVRLQDAKTLFEWVAKRGVDQNKFTDTYNSFGVRSRVQRAIDLSRAYNIPGTPALVVDGRYLTAPHLGLGQGEALSYERYFKIVDHVVAVARKARAGK